MSEITELSVDIKRILTGEVLGDDPDKVYAIIGSCRKCNEKYHYKYPRHKWRDYVESAHRRRVAIKESCESDYWDNTVYLNYTF